MTTNRISRHMPDDARPPRHSSRRPPRLAAGAAAAAAAVCLTAGSAPAAIAAGGTAGAGTAAGHGPVSCGPPHVLPQVVCYTPAQYQVAYGVQSLLGRGINGHGETVVMPELANTPSPSFTDIRKDLATFDATFGLAPATLRITTTLAGAKHPYVAGTEEVEDTEIIHAIAPGATLDVVLVPHNAGASAANFTTAVTGVVRAGIAQGAAVISISASIGEHFVTPAQAARIHAALKQARGRHVTVVASSGDGGAVSDQGLPKQVSLPASDPLVLAAGGTSLNASHQTGAYHGEMAWNELTDASGGGYSRLFRRPSYQHSIARLGATRGVPDVAADADDRTAMALDFTGGTFLPARGTSAATPLWAAVIALADQAAGQHLGFINPAIYHIARSPAYHRAFHDVLTGDNSVMLPTGVMVGYQAAPGWDPVTGWGSPNAQNLIPLLAPGAHPGGTGHS